MIVRACHELDNQKLIELANSMVKYLGLDGYPEKESTHPENKDEIATVFLNFDKLISPLSRETLLAALKTLPLKTQNKIFSKVKSVKDSVHRNTFFSHELVYYPRDSEHCFKMQCQSLRSKFEVINGLTDLYKSLLDHSKRKHQSLWDEVIVQARFAELGCEKNLQDDSAKYWLVYGLACIDTKKIERAIDAFITAMKKDETLTPMDPSSPFPARAVPKPDPVKLTSLFYDGSKGTLGNALLYLSQKPEDYEFYRKFMLTIVKNAKALFDWERDLLITKEMAYYLINDAVNTDIGRNLLSPMTFCIRAVHGWEFFECKLEGLSKYLRGYESFSKISLSNVRIEEYLRISTPLYETKQMLLMNKASKSDIAAVHNKITKAQLLDEYLKKMQNSCNAIMQINDADLKLGKVQEHVIYHSECIGFDYVGGFRQTRFGADHYYLRAAAFIRSSVGDMKEADKLYFCGMAAYDLNKCYLLRPEQDEVMSKGEVQKQDTVRLSRNRLKSDRLCVELFNAGPDFIFNAIMATNEMQQLHFFESCLATDLSSRSLFAEVMQSKAEKMTERVNYLKTINSNTDTVITDQKDLRLAEVIMNSMIPTQREDIYEEKTSIYSPWFVGLTFYYQYKWREDFVSIIGAIDALPRALRLKYLDSKTGGETIDMLEKERPGTNKLMYNRLGRMRILNGKNDDKLTTEDWQKLVEYYVSLESQRALIMAAYSSERGLEVCLDKDGLNLKLASLIITAGIGCEVFDRLIAKYPQSANLYFGRALCHLHAKKYIEAIYDIYRSGVSKDELKKAINSVGCEDITSLSPEKILKLLRKNSSLTQKEKLFIYASIFRHDIFDLLKHHETEIAEMNANLRTEIARDNQPSPVFSRALTFFSRGVDQEGNPEIELEVMGQEAKKSHEKEKEELEGTIFSINM